MLSKRRGNRAGYQSLSQMAEASGVSSGHAPIGAFRGVLLVVLCLCLSACTGPAYKTEQAELTAARQRWQAQQLSNYRMNFRWNCFCPLEEVLIEVENAQIVSVVDAESQKPIEDVSQYKTVAGLFDFLQDALNDRPHDYMASYDPGQGFPTSAYIDYEANVIDEELGFELFSLTPLP